MPYFSTSTRPSYNDFAPESQSVPSLRVWLDKTPETLAMTKTTMKRRKKMTMKKQNDKKPETARKAYSRTSPQPLYPCHLALRTVLLHQTR